MGVHYYLSTQQLDASDQIIQSVIYGYDTLLRTQTVTDSRTGTTTYTYYTDDQIASVIAPEPVAGADTLTTAFFYDSAGRLERRVLPDGTEEHSQYNLAGNLLKQWGSQRYPIEYSYDMQGRLKTQTTWQQFDQSSGNGTAGSAVTQWIYDPQRGTLASKLHADGKGTSYAYTPTGRLQTRTWARGVETTYDYDTSGQMSSIDYSDSTPDVVFSYTRSGQLDVVQDGTLSNGVISDANKRYEFDLDYDSNNQLATEQINTAVDRLITRQYETSSDTVPGRYIGYDLGTTSTPQSVTTTRYGYDAAGRLSTVTAPNVNYTYNYLPQSNLIEEIQGNVHSVNYQYESGRNAMTSIANTVSSTIVSKHSSRFDKLSRRTDVTRTGTAFSQDHMSKYYYDQLGQLTADQRFEGTNPETPGSALEAQTFSFLYDTIGNRKESIQGTLTSTYTSNSLNQYSDIAGLIEMEPIHDDDGNLIQDMQNTYTWNGENRLILVEPIVPKNGSKRVEFTYDYLGRRVSKTVLIYNTGSWQADSVTAFVYDGWNVVEKTTFTSTETINRTYTWGIDLSGSLQGAGGVGGLLAQTYSDSSSTQTYYYTYDFNGNVSELLDASGSISAHYQYGPFGQVIHQYGDFADDNKYRFSTKYTDVESGWLYYGYRFYDPEIGRWLNRDPIQEQGGLNLYGFVGNDAVNAVDVLGMASRKSLIKAFCKLKCPLREEFLERLGYKDIFFFKDDGKNIRIRIYEDADGNRYEVPVGKFSGTVDYQYKIIYTLNNQSAKKTLVTLYHESDHIDNDVRLRQRTLAGAVAQRVNNEIRAFTVSADFAQRAGLPNQFKSSKGPRVADISKYVQTHYGNIPATRKPKKPKTPDPSKPKKPKPDRFIKETHRETLDGSIMTRADFKCKN